MNQSAHLIDSDITLLRERYNEALQMQGIPCKYQYPGMPDSNVQGETVVDTYSDEIETHVFFEGSPKVRTFKRYGWVVENNQDLPFLIHCSYNLPHVQKDSLFKLSGEYTDMPERIFKVTEISYDLQAPDHIVCQIVPVYDKEHVTGRTKQEIKETFNRSNYFLKQDVDYRGDDRDNSKKGDE